ncbi:murein L,D-transpeptidase catalytic domain family protein [Qipengyuania sp. RANM35]|uniref:murein L,D-transpeptidase catalytic domain family protein n=1 Tax=Qipengyuania sp. RANM35 TaxID=3068635 RepID=UPI0034DB7B67
MTISRRQFIGAGICVGAGFASPGGAIIAPPSQSPSIPPSPALPPVPPVIQSGLEALSRHHASVVHRDRMAIADYSQASSEARFHIIDVQQGRIEASYLVSHGRGSDPSNSGFVERFSNRPGSNASSSGSFLTDDIYYGKHGRSRRLRGLDAENNLAWDRSIVIHGAEYVDRSMAELQGRVGRSLGCFAFEQGKIDEILELLGPGRLLFSTK